MKIKHLPGHISAKIRLPKLSIPILMRILRNKAKIKNKLDYLRLAVRELTMRL